MTDPITPEDDDDTEDVDDELPDDYQPGRPVLTDKPELDVAGTPDDPADADDHTTDDHTED